MKTKFRALSLLLALTLAVSLLPGAVFAESAPWYGEAMAWAQRREIVLPEADPFSPLTRGQAYALLCSAAGGEDTLPWAAETGLLPDGEGPLSQVPVTRADLAVLLYRRAQYMGAGAPESGLSAYSDSDLVPEQAVPAFAWLTEKGVVNGIDGALAPDRPCTLAEAVTMLFRYGGDRSVECFVDSVSRHGNAHLSLSSDALHAAGFEPGDMVTVLVGEAEYVMPIGTSYSDVNPGEPLLLDKGGELSLCVNLRSFAEMAGLDDSPAGTAVTVSLAEKAGYLREYQVRSMVYTDDRGDYPSDEVFCNFRPVNMGRLKENILYRAASAVDNGRGRAALADALYEKAGIRTAVDLADSEEAIAAAVAAEGFASPYYRSLFEAGAVVTCGALGVDFTAETFRRQLADDLRAMSLREGPYLIHCLEGKDRTGFALMLLEALTGASYEEMLADYMLSFVNYYHLERDSTQYGALLRSNAAYLFLVLSGEEQLLSPEETDWERAAAAYLTGSGMTEAEIAALRSCLEANP